MSFTNQTTRIDYDGDGIVVAFAFAFKIFNETDLEVYVGGVLQTITTNYTVAINATGEGGTVTFVVAPPTGTSNVIIKRVLDLTQQTDIPTESNFPEEQIENAIDKSRMLDVQANEIVGRTLVLANLSLFKNLIVPDPSSDKILGWNTAGTAMENKTIADIVNLANALAIANNLSDLNNVETALINLGITGVFRSWKSHAVTDGQAATNLAAETVVGTAHTAAIYHFEIIRGTTVHATGKLALHYRNTVWTLIIDDGYVGDVHGVTFSITGGATVQLRAALDVGAGNGTIKLSRQLVTV